MADSDRGRVRMMTYGVLPAVASASSFVTTDDNTAVDWGRCRSTTTLRNNESEFVSFSARVGLHTVPKIGCVFEASGGATGWRSPNLLSASVSTRFADRCTLELHLGKLRWGEDTKATWRGVARSGHERAIAASLGL